VKREGGHKRQQDKQSKAKQSNSFAAAAARAAFAPSPFRPHRKRVTLPALAVDNDILGRKPGEALWPEQFPAEELDKKRMLCKLKGTKADNEVQTPRMVRKKKRFCQVH
jgi:hypothetical protein